MLKRTLLKQGVMPEQIDNQDYFDLLEVLSAPDELVPDFADTSSNNSSSYDNVKWAD